MTVSSEPVPCARKPSTALNAVLAVIRGGIKTRFGRKSLLDSAREPLRVFSRYEDVVHEFPDHPILAENAKLFYEGADLACVCFEEQERIILVNEARIREEKGYPDHRILREYIVHHQQGHNKDPWLDDTDAFAYGRVFSQHEHLRRERLAQTYGILKTIQTKKLTFTETADLCRYVINTNTDNGYPYLWGGSAKALLPNLHSTLKDIHKTRHALQENKICRIACRIAGRGHMNRLALAIHRLKPKSS